MDDLDFLRENLVIYIKKKFYTRRNIVEMADDIVNQAFLDVLKTSEFKENQCNFGYMSVACIRTAYKVFHRNDRDDEKSVEFDSSEALIDEDSFVYEIEKAEDTAYILESLQTLKQIEQIIINERYFGDFTFKEISERHGVKLNTVLSHHRRALAKLKPVLSRYFEFHESIYHYGKKD